MALDPKIEESIRLSVSQYGQSESLATKIISWMQSVISGNEDINDNKTVRRHVELLYEVTETKKHLSDE